MIALLSFRARLGNEMAALDDAVGIQALLWVELTVRDAVAALRGVVIGPF